MCSAQKNFLGFLTNIDVFCRKISENLKPLPHFQTSWQTFYVLCKIIYLLATYLI